MMKNDQLKPSLLGLFSRLYYKNHKFEPNLHSFELCLEIITFTQRYLAKHWIPDDTIFEVGFGEFIVIESIVDPYNLVAKISESLGDEAKAQ